MFSDSLTGGSIWPTALSTEPRFRKTARTQWISNIALAVPLGLTWDRRDSKTDAKHGFYIDAEAKPFLGFGTTGSGLRLSADLRGYRGIDAEDRFVVAARIQAGLVTGASLLETPRDDLFYSGGGGTVRGQPFQSLGVNLLRGPISYQIGGNRFLAGSLDCGPK